MASAPAPAIALPAARLSRLRPHNLRLQLRARITMAFSFGALALCLTVATVAYLSARSSVVGQAVGSAESTALSSARTLQAIHFTTGSQNVLSALTNFDKASNSITLYEHGGDWIDASPYTAAGRLGTFEHHNLPQSLQDAVNAGEPAEQMFSFAGSTYISVGYPVNGDGFYEVFPTTAIATTLHRILLTLILATVITTLAGAVLGRWAARRVLRPLRDAATAAAAIATGELDIRLETEVSSDLAELASSFNQMVDNVQQRIEREARFASDVAHELRSPLTTLATAFSVLESRRDELSARSRQALDLLGAEVNRFQRMVFDLLEISRLDAGAANLALSIVSTGELVRKTLISAGAPDIPLVIDEEAAGRYLNVDKRRFERVIANLLTNALRHAGGATRVVVTSTDSVVRIAVEDGGPGVPPEDRERIFGRFARGVVTAGSRGRGGGTGLGLALVAEHVKLHNGRVWVEDADGGGARFVVELPLAPIELVGDEDEELPNASAR